jgi:hypothetical protein
VLTFKHVNNTFEGKGQRATLLQTLDLMALATTIYLSLMGRDGLKAAGTLSFKRAPTL